MSVPKWVRVLEALASGRSWNRFEAARDLGDHCLHSTVASLQKMGLPVARRMEKVRGFGGIPTECCRYWLDPANIARAMALLAAFKSRRDAASLKRPLMTCRRVGRGRRGDAAAGAHAWERWE